jgi:hypothetical protein
MPPKQYAFHLDLPALNAVEFSAYLRFEDVALDKVVALARGGAINLEEGYTVQYTRSGKRHELSIHFLRPASDAKVQGLHILYDLEPTTRKGTSSRVARMLSALQQQEIRATLNCDATFVMPAEDWKSAFPLPWTIFDDEQSVPFDQVTGLRVSKKDGDKPLWSAIVDRQGDVYVCSPRYSIAGYVREDVFGEALVRGADIAARLVRPTKAIDS